MSEYIVKCKKFTGITGNELEFPEYIDTNKEIVRCRDCVKFSEQEPDGEIGTCELGLEDTGLVSIVEPNGFCAWGERRERKSAEVWNQWSVDDVTCSEES